jgi:hypothetical protein
MMLLPWVDYIGHSCPFCGHSIGECFETHWVTAHHFDACVFGLGTYRDSEKFKSHLMKDHCCMDVPELGILVSACAVSIRFKNSNWASTLPHDFTLFAPT